VASNVCFYTHLHDGDVKRGFEEADIIVRESLFHIESTSLPDGASPGDAG